MSASDVEEMYAQRKPRRDWLLTDQPLHLLPRPTGRQLLTADGVVHTQRPGTGGEWVPDTSVGGARRTSTTPGGAALAPAVGPRLQARDSVIGGGPATTRDGQRLFPAAAPTPFMPR